MLVVGVIDSVPPAVDVAEGLLVRIRDTVGSADWEKEAVSDTVGDDENDGLTLPDAVAETEGDDETVTVTVSVPVPEKVAALVKVALEVDEAPRESEDVGETNKLLLVVTVVVAEALTLPVARMLGVRLPVGLVELVVVEVEDDVG
jgi:hypothetical protein